MMTAGQFATARRGGLTGYEAEFVRQKTAAGVPLSAVSRMLGRNIESLRDHAAAVEPRGVVIVEPEPEEPVDPLEGVPLTAARIIKRIAALCNTTPGALVGTERTTHVAFARQYAMYALRVTKGSDGAPRYSHAEIGRFLHRDHTTVLHGVRAHCQRFDLDLPA